jgi:hypothetical protein
MAMMLFLCPENPVFSFATEYRATMPDMKRRHAKSFCLVRPFSAKPLPNLPDVEKR